MARFDATGLGCWLQQYGETILVTIPYGSPTVNLVTRITGVKCQIALNTLEVSATLKRCTCTRTPDGETEPMNRIMKVYCLEAEDEFCDLDFLCSRYETEIRRTAGQESLGSIYQWIVASVVADVANKLEILAWQGDTGSSDTFLSLLDGYLKIADEDAAPVDPTVQPGIPDANRFTQAAGESDSEFIQRIFLSQAAINAEYRGNLAVFVGIDRFRSILAGLINLRIQYVERPLLPEGQPLTPNFMGAQEVNLDFLGINGTLYGVPGLSGTNRIFVASLNNMFFGTDYADDYETIDFDYSKYHKVWFYSIKFFAGFEIALPSEVLTGTFTSAIGTVQRPAVNVNIISPLNVGGNAVAVDDTPITRMAPSSGTDINVNLVAAATPVEEAPVEEARVEETPVEEAPVKRGRKPKVDTAAVEEEPEVEKVIIE